MKHLTDTQIQTMVDNPESLPEEVQEHLANCRQCADSLKGYQRLGTMLQRKPEPDFSKNFTDKILDQVAVDPSFSFTKWFNLIILPGLAFVCLPLIILFQMNVFKLPESSISVNPLISEFSSIFSTISGFFSRHIGSPGLAIVAVLVLALFMLIDRWIIQPRFTSPQTP